MAISREVYTENERFLWGVCYRMTGNAADAEDLVQETFVRAMEKPPRNTQLAWRPWLLRVAINLSRNQLRRRRKRGYEGPWLPSPIPTSDQDLSVAEARENAKEDSPAARYDKLESISMAFLLTLEALTPCQRAVLLLRDVFDYSTRETADVLEITESGVKVILHRARRIMREYDKDRATFSPRRREMTQHALERFLACLKTNDLHGLEKLLAEDVVAISDGGGEVNAVHLPIEGRKKVLQFVTRWNQANRESIRPRICQLNGLPALLVQRSDVKPRQSTRFTLQCEIDQRGHIRRLHYVLAPGKLTAVPAEPL